MHLEKFLHIQNRQYGDDDHKNFIGLELRECRLLVLNSVPSTPQWIRQPKPRDMHHVCVFVCDNLNKLEQL